MEVTGDYLTRATMWLFITTLIYFLMNGAQLFETAVIVPKWTAAPPESLQLLAGRFGLDFKFFWIVLHTVHEITFIMAIVFCWRLESVRNWLLLLFLIHFMVRVWTLTYFAPNIIDFQKIANTAQYSIDIVKRVTMWRFLNYIRVAIFLGVSIGLIPLCIKILKYRVA